MIHTVIRIRGKEGDAGGLLREVIRTISGKFNNRTQWTSRLRGGGREILNGDARGGARVNARRVIKDDTLSRVNGLTKRGASDWLVILSLRLSTEESSSEDYRES